MKPKMLLLTSCMGILFLTVELEANHEKTIMSLNSRLLRSTGTLPVNPSVHVALRLSERHSLHNERSYLRRLKTDLQRKLSRSQPGSEPSTGLVALYLLALRASCQDLHEQRSALLYLKNKLGAERNHTMHHHVPLTNHYQYGLGVLAVCLSNIRMDHSVLSGLVSHDHHFHHSIDTSAMVVLALKCVQDSKVPSSNKWMYSHDRRLKAQNAVNKLMEKIRKQQKSSGEIRNIYSTPLALQALLATGDKERWLKGRSYLLNEAKRKAFQNPMALSQLLPVLYQKTYLGIGQMDCHNETGGLRWMDSEPSNGEPEPNSPSEFVYLRVMDENLATIYEASVPLHNGMSLLEVLHEAKRNDTNFDFETVPTLWGPFLTSVNHIMGQDNMRTYWRLISETRTPLIEGVQDYHPQPGEHILLQLSNF
ncbi:transcobalamin-2 [Pristis pectinata]|uniref:transcobalamin-2 n=1 Tax=Pristis pectinata TaxID=685728 RepID=UPI00223DAD94|nr:transcobalamin-2 [Pristis pectinata]